MKSAHLVLAVLVGACGGDDQARRDVADGAPDTIDDGAAGDAPGDTTDDTTAPPPPLNASPSSAGRELWVGFAENLSLASNGPPTFVFYVSAEAATLGRVEVPRTGYTQPFQVGAGEVVAVTMPQGVLYPQVDETASRLGVRITADLPVSVVAVHYRIYFSEATRVLPLDELGDEYVVVTAVDVQGMSPSSIVVVATEDDTEVEVTPSTVTTGFLPTGATHTFTLQAGETFQIQAGGDLSGTRVRARGGKRIAVFAGARQAHIGCVGADSHLWDQMLPLARWGTRHVVVPFGGAGATPVKIVADRFKTAVDVSCQPSLLVSPGAGEIVAVARPTVLRSNERVGVVMLVKSNACMKEARGDPNLVVVPPLDLVTRRATWSTAAAIETLSAAEHRVNVLALAADPPTLDGQALALEALPDLEGLVWGQVVVGPGDHVLVGSSGFQATMYGLAPFEAYTFAGGFGCDPTVAGAAGCGALGAPVPSAACDPGDLRLDTPSRPTDPGGGGGDPARECERACDCYAQRGEPSGTCAEGEPVWRCERTCAATCGDPCEACPERFASEPDGRCP